MERRVEHDLEKGHVRARESIAAPMLVATVTIQLILVLICVMNYDGLYEASVSGACASLSSSLSGLSQGLLQLFIYQKLNPTKLLKFYIWGIASGLWTNFWTSQLTELIGSAFLRIFWDQTIGTPFSLFLFLSFSAFWDGINVDNYLNTNFYRTLRASYVIWPLASTIAFTCLPVTLIVPFNSLVNLVWTVILGLIP